MKKIIFCISALCLFLYVNAFSQTVMNHANDINDAGKSAAQSHNATHSRSINNAAWAGAAIFGIGACTGIMSGVDGAKKYESATDYAKRIKMVQKTGMAAAGVLAAGGVALGYYSYKAVSLIINSNLL